ncbi:hypothetical protein ACH5RR_005718 [Cinchona calisaya]|uniref:Transmembrane protein n=1 Tax=Cinchona calisaya TaxID=153742 RepID=A0ABD3AM39_9GENT
MDNNSLGTGFMAVFAVSGSVVLLAMQVHKRLLSDFMKKMEFEIGPKKIQQKKKVRFADDVVEYPSSDHKVEGRTKDDLHSRLVEEKLEALPLNWQALYKGIIKYRGRRGLN